MRTAKRGVCVGAFAVALAAAFPAQATVFSLFTFLSGAQEVPPNASPGFDDAQMTYDDVTNELAWTIDFADLLAPTVAAHFHEAPPGVNGPIIVPIDLGAFAGATAGTLTGSGLAPDVNEAALLSGGWYLNIHSTMFPGGEIRGQVAIPEPGLLGLLGLAAAGLIGVQRSRRASISG